MDGTKPVHGSPITPLHFSSTHPFEAIFYVRDVGAKGATSVVDFTLAIDVSMTERGEGRGGYLLSHLCLDAKASVNEKAVINMK